MPLSGLWLPPTATERVEPRRIWKCTLCGKKMPREQKAQFQRHLVACSKRNDDVIQAQAAKRRENIFLDGTSDPERRDWINKRIEDPLKEFDDLKDGLFI